jgi:hypothetical protein
MRWRVGIRARYGALPRAATDHAVQTPMRAFRRENAELPHAASRSGRGVPMRCGTLQGVVACPLTLVSPGSRREVTDKGADGSRTVRTLLISEPLGVSVKASAHASCHACKSSVLSSALGWSTASLLVSVAGSVGCDAVSVEVDSGVCTWKQAMVERCLVCDDRLGTTRYDRPHTVTLWITVVRSRMG